MIGTKYESAIRCYPVGTVKFNLAADENRSFSQEGK